MTPPGGAGTSIRRHCDANRGPLHSLTTFLLTLLLLCPLIAAQRASPASLERHEWSRHVIVDVDGIATSRGIGRRRSDGLSVTRSLPVKSDIVPDALVDDQAIRFTPTRVNLGRMKTCIPERYYVRVENNGRVPVTLDRADFTHEGFSLANDVRGIRLDPGDRFNVKFVFLPSQVEPNGINAHLRVLTSSGLFSLPISSSEVAPNRYGVSAVRASIPAGKYFEQSLEFTNPSDSMIRISEIYASNSLVDRKLVTDSDWIFGSRWLKEDDEEEYITSKVRGQDDKAFDYSRRAGRGAWDIPAGTTSLLILVSVQTHALGVHLMYLHIATNDKLLLLVPVRITVLKPGIHIEPEEVDLGVLTDSYEDEARELFFSLYNAGSNPIKILEIKVLESKLIVAAQLRGPAVILAQTRAYHALAVQVRVNRDIIGGSCIASLLLKTNASKPELQNRKLRLYGQVVKGHLAFQLNQTFVGVVVPLKRVFVDDEKAADFIEEKGSERIVKVQETPAVDLVSIASEKNSMAVLVGSSQVKTLRLWNRFDCPVEVQRVWVDDVLPDNDNPQEVVVHEFQQVVVPVGASLPTILLQITPTFQNQDKLATSRSYSLMVETNGTLDRIPIYVYNGFLTLNSTRGLHSYSASGYYSDLHPESTGECLLVPRGGVVPATPRIDGGKVLTDTNAVHICRSLLFDLDKVASHKARMEMVEVTNHNPVPLTFSIMKVSKNETVNVSIAAEISKAELFSRFPHSAGAGAGDKWNDNTNFVSAGDSSVLQPGYRVVFHIKIKAKDTFGKITVPVMSLTTESEVFHLYARFVSVRGTIEPVTPVIVLPAMFPGRIESIQLQYRNTFDHLVTALEATVSSSKLQLLPIRGTMAPRTVESVLNLIFYPWEDSACLGMLYFADCLLPLPDPFEEQKCYQLSDYGAFVDKYDLDALRRRDAFWFERAATGTHLTSEAQVRLQTDIMDDVAEVTIKALLQRPMVTAPAGMALDPNNESLTVFGRKEFALTGLLEVNHIFVHVRNPSNFSIMMELAIAEADDDLFYFCDEELRHTLQYAESDVKYDGPDSISELCLEEWKTAAAARHESRQKIDVPPFYYQKKIIKVHAGEETQLGPIYYLPSKVQEVSTRVFVRNDLTHIEPVSLFAQSGKGTLNILVDTPTDRKSTPSYYTAGESAAASEDKKPTQRSAPVEFDGTLSFSLSTDDALTNFTQVAEIVLSNTGRYGLTIRSVAVERDDYVSWKESTWTSESSPSSDFVVTSDDFSCGRDDSKRIPKLLAPGEAAKFQVSFYASCFTARSSRWLIIDTSDSVKGILLEGTISTDAAFTCLRSRTPPSSRFTFVAVWMLAVVIAVISILYTIFLLTRDAWTSELELVGERQSEQFDVHSENSDTKVVEVTAPENHEKSSTTALDNKSNAFPHQSLASINRILADMEQVSLAPPACVMMPAVAELLERRRKELHSTVRNRSPQNDQLSKNDKAGNDNQNGKTTALTAKAKANDNKKVVRPSDQVPASDVASTARMASLRDAQNKVLNDAGRTDMLPATNATRLVTTLEQHFKCSSKKSDKSWSEKPTKGFRSSALSAIGPPDAEQSSRTAKFSKFSMDFSGSSHHGIVRSAPVASSPPKKEETSFEAFKSLSERWRTETEQDDLKDHSRPAWSEKFPGLEEWHDTLSFNTLAHDLGGPTAGRNRRGDTTARLYLDGFSAPSIPMPAEAKPITATTKPSPRKAPPGFTSADARPVEARAAFERFRTSGETASSVPTPSNGFSGGSLFANNLPLFGPALPPKTDHIPLGSAGCIGSGRSKLLRSLDVPQDSTK